MSENSVRWLTPLQSETADHLADLLDQEAATTNTDSDAMLEASLVASGATLPAPALTLAETVPAAAPGTPEAMINAAVAGKAGLVVVSLPELPYPLWFRAGTRDAETCIAALSPDAGGGRIPYQPRRILELGAEAGYRTVALARSFPEAEIIATESDPAYAKVNSLNTAPYRNVTFLAAPVTLQPTRFETAGRRPPVGAVNLVQRPEGSIRSIPIADLLERRGWENLDTVIISPDVASITLLRNNVWPATVRMIIIRTGGEPLGPQVVAAYPEARFVVRPEGDYTAIYRRDVAASLPPPVPVPVFDPSGPPTAIALAHVANLPARYFPIFPHGFRLHPNGPREPAPTLSVSCQCNGYRQLMARLRVGHKESKPIRFSVRMIAEAGGRELLHAEQVVNAGEEVTISPEIPVFFGACQVVFSTRMAEQEANQYGWAEFLDAAFL